MDSVRCVGCLRVTSATGALVAHQLSLCHMPFLMVVMMSHNCVREIQVAAELKTSPPPPKQLVGRAVLQLCTTRSLCTILVVHQTTNSFPKLKQKGGAAMYCENMLPLYSIGDVPYIYTRQHWEEFVHFCSKRELVQPCTAKTCLPSLLDRCGSQHVQCCASPIMTVPRHV